MSKTTSRRNLLKIAAGGGIAAGLGMSMKPGSEAKPTPQWGHGGHGKKHRRVRGPLSSATVTFGAWAADPLAPLDRSPNLAPLDKNVHLLVPDEVTIQSEGVVNFIVQGAHQIAIYDHGTRPEDIGTTSEYLVPPAAGGAPILINDPRKRIYRGLDFSTLPLLSLPPVATQPPAPPALPFLTDRVEAVQFTRPGDYLVICTIIFHFRPAAWRVRDVRLRSRSVAKSLGALHEKSKGRRMPLLAITARRGISLLPVRNISSHWDRRAASRQNIESRRSRRFDESG